MDDEAEVFCVKTYDESTSFKIVQVRYRRKFNFKFPNKSHIFKLVKNFEDIRTISSLLSDKPRETSTRHQDLNMPHLTVPSGERRTSETCNL